ncbi:hypothetical protein DFA_11899 [Cavenderia fasciculata]|uniref:Uncharacterized protein n=1 Tax=Cavenderia fasciculata TaxID=261658 RepID=F4QEM1_CACFS|nr:uncharacterized protein DFA_11899 [Cavenderia fasciculata]EGG14132.1 hypothetical protein DFA_11899 [Cavenderia fasciculata]|eukprot:XP_004350840.1 hypothetical protein DFA_11899 [Cavenderia fasciculata]
MKSTILFIVLIIATVYSQQIVNVQQLYKTLYIQHTPEDMNWSFNSLVNGGLLIDMKQYCDAEPGILSCTLPNIPDCESISLVGSIAGQGETNVHMVTEFNCTVYHLDEF